MGPPRRDEAVNEHEWDPSGVRGNSEQRSGGGAALAPGNGTAAIRAEMLATADRGIV